MRNLAFCILFSAFGLAANAASPAATQQWVRDYVSSNVTTIAEATAMTPSLSVTCQDPDSGEDVVVTLEMTEATVTNAALAVSESNVAGMPVGIKYAKSGDYAYANATNAACTAFSGAYEKYGYKLSGSYYQFVTNGAVVVTNLLYAITNDNYMTRFTAYVNGEKFKSTEAQSGAHLFICETNSASYFKMLAVRIGETERRTLVGETTASARNPIVDLLIPSAYAITRYEDEAKPTNRVGDKWHVHYTGRVLTDENDVTEFGVKTINWGSNSISVDWTALEVKAGENFLEVYNRLDNLAGDCDDGTLLADFKATLKQSLGTAKFRQLERALTSDGKNALVAAIDLMMENALKYVVNQNFAEWKDWLAKHNNENGDVATNPYAFYEEVDVEDEEEDPPLPPAVNPPVVPPEGHTHSNPTGTCGAWTCGVCGQRYVPADAAHPSTHEWQWSSTLAGCQHCQYCGVSNPNLSGHTGWRNETILESSDNLRYPFWGSKYSYKYNGDYYGFYERCALGSPFYMRNHEMTYTNIWTQIIEGGSADITYDCHHRVCQNYKWHNSDPSDYERCDFGTSGDQTTMLAAGAWVKDSHTFVYPEELGLMNSWLYLADDPYKCYAKKICSHGQHKVNGIIINEGCGYETYEDEPHAATSDFHATALDSGDPNCATNHKVNFVCAHGCGFSTNIENIAHCWGSEYVSTDENLHDVTNHWVVHKCEKDGTISFGGHTYTYGPCNIGEVKIREEPHTWSVVGSPEYYNEVYHTVHYVCACGATKDETVKHDKYDEDKWSINVFTGQKVGSRWFAGTADGGFHARTNYCTVCAHYYGGTQGCRYFGGGGFVEFPKEKDDDGNEMGLSYWKGTCPYCSNTHYIEKGNWLPYPPVEPGRGISGHAHTFAKSLHSVGGSDVGTIVELEGHVYEASGLGPTCRICGFLNDNGYCPTCHEEDATCYFPGTNGVCKCSMCIVHSYDLCQCHLAGSSWTISESTITPSVGKNKHKGDTTLLGVSSMATTVENGGMESACEGCVNLRSVSFPKLQVAGDNAFDPAFGGCTNLAFISFPSLITCGTHCFGSTFTGCVNLVTAKFERVEMVGPHCFSNSFEGCSSLKCIDLRSLDELGDYMFDGSTCPATDVTVWLGGGYIGAYTTPLYGTFDVDTYYFLGTPPSEVAYYMNAEDPARIRVTREHYQDWMTNSVWNAYTNRIDVYDYNRLSDWKYYSNDVETTSASVEWTGTNWQVYGYEGTLQYGPAATPEGANATNIIWGSATSESDFHDYKAYRHWTK